MSLLQQCGLMRILRILVAVAFMLLLLVSYSRGEETAQRVELNSVIENALQSSFVRSTCVAMNSEENSVLPPSDGSVPDMTGKSPADSEENSSDIGVDEKIGETISSPIYFTDSTGAKIDIRALMSVPTLIVPVYYACTDVCQLLLSDIAGALPYVTLTPGTDYKIIAVSFNHKESFDIAAKKKKEYLQAARRSDASFPCDAWMFLTGDKQSIATLMNEIGFKFKLGKEEYMHPIVTVAVSPEGQIIRYLYGIKVSPFDLTMALTEGDTTAPVFSGKRIAQTCYIYDSEQKEYVLDLALIAEGALVGLIVILGLFLLFEEESSSVTGIGMVSGLLMM